MSRKIIYKDELLTLVNGNDHMLGDFLQLYDKDLQLETPEGEGLILNWSTIEGIETNFTGIHHENPEEIAEQYIKEYGDIKFSFKNL